MMANEETYVQLFSISPLHSPGVSSEWKSTTSIDTTSFINCQEQIQESTKAAYPGSTKTDGATLQLFPETAAKKEQKGIMEKPSMKQASPSISPSKFSFLLSPTKMLQQQYTKNILPMYKTDEDSEEDTTMCMENNAHYNTLFEYDDVVPSDSQVQCLSRFGKKGRDAGRFSDATSIQHLDSNILLITDMLNSRLQTFYMTGELIDVCDFYNVIRPWCAIPLPNGEIALSSQGKKCVLLLTATGGIKEHFGQEYFKCPSGIARDQSGLHVVTDTVANSVKLYDSEFRKISNLDNNYNLQYNFSHPRYVCFSPTGQIIVSNSGNHSIQIFDHNGSLITKFGTYGRCNGQFRSPYGICTDQQGNILVADHYNDRISMFTHSGEFISHIISERHSLKHPQGIVLTPDNKLCITYGGLKATKVVVFQLKMLNK